MTDGEITPLEVDRESLLELARGANLYGDRFSFVRELIQNAVDATLLRLFAEQGPEAFPTNPQSLVDLRRRLQAYPIDVSIGRLEGTPNVCRVAVDDKGMGIAQADLAYLQKIGSSRKNPSRVALIEAMPEWMRPSGTFGIGLQSAFLVSDELRLVSRPLEGEALEIVLRRGDGGTVSVRPAAREDIGTHAELDIPFETTGWSRWIAASYGWENADVDPLDESFDKDLLDARRLAQDIASASLPPVRIDGRPAEASWATGADFDEQALIELSLPTTDDNVMDARELARPLGRYAQSSEQKIMFYRGAPLTAGVPILRGVPWSYNAHFGGARELLDLGRTHLRFDATPQVESRLKDALLRRVPSLARRLRRTGAAPRLLAMYSEYLLGEGVEGAGDEWRNVAVGVRAEMVDTARGPRPSPDGTFVTLGDLEDLPWVGFGGPLNELPDGTGVIIAMGLAGTESLRRLFPGFHMSGEFTRVTRDPAVIVEESALEQTISADANSARPLIHIPDTFSRLRIRSDEGWRAHFGREQRWAMNFAPWTIRDGEVSAPNLPQWVEWTAACRKEESSAHREIAEELGRFFQRFDPVLRSQSSLRVAYDLDEVLSVLDSIGR